MVRIELSNPGTDSWAVPVESGATTWTANVSAGAVLPVFGDAVTVGATRFEVTQAVLAVRSVGVQVLPQPAATRAEITEMGFILAGVMCAFVFWDLASPFHRH